MRVHFTNLGCKLNQAELERLAREFHAAGHRVVGRLEEADLHVVNTCTVTHAAARTSRKTARRGGRVRPGLKTVLTGCYVSDTPEEAARLAGVDLVVGNEHKDDLLERVHRAFPELAVPAPEGAPGREALPAEVPYVPLAFGNTRALVKVEDGCNVGCAFCIIPSTRGRQRSRPPEEVVAEVEGMVARGVREVVVTGVQISHYRHRGARLPDLVATLLERTAVPRLRLTSIAPWGFEERLLELWRRDREGEGRLCRHVHMSLQSGCDATLRRMGRPYTASGYLELVERLREALPGLAVTTDVIAGFPGESDEEFAESLETVRRARFAKVHAFPYSARQGTAAAEMPGQVPHGVKRQRMAALLQVAEAAERRFRDEHLGTVAEVLWEERRDGAWTGTTDNYLRVTAPADGGPDLANILGPARLVRLADDGLRGVPLTAGRPSRAGTAGSRRSRRPPRGTPAR